MTVPKKSQLDVTKTTIKKAADISVKAALSFIPGGTTVYELSQLGLAQAKAYIEQKQNHRIESFHTMLLGKDEDWNNELADTYIEAADYHLLLAACVQDLEDEKTEMYANLAKNAAQRRIASKDIRFFTLSLRELSLNDVKEMQEAYITNKYAIIPPQGAGSYKKNLKIDDASEDQIYGRGLMEQRGFVKEGILSSYGERFIESCHNSDKLIPSAVNMKEWKNPNSPILLLCYEIGDPYITRFFMRLSENLREKGYKTSPLTALTRVERSTLFVWFTLLIFKDKSDLIIQNIQFVEPILKKSSFAIQLAESFPTELESVKHLFSEVLAVDEKDPITAADKITNLIVDGND